MRDVLWSDACGIKVMWWIISRGTRGADSRRRAWGVVSRGRSSSDSALIPRNGGDRAAVHKCRPASGGPCLAAATTRTARASTCVEINQCVRSRDRVFIKSFLADDAGVLAETAAMDYNATRRAGVASMAWRSRLRA